MKRFPSSVRTSLALAGLLATASALSGQAIPNPSFEEDEFGTFPGYISGNGPISGWQGEPADRVGLNPAAGSPFANNGAVPDGTKVAFLQNHPGGVSSLFTTATELTPGVRYNVAFRVNARSQGALNYPFVRLSSDGEGEPVLLEVGRVSDAVNETPWHHAAFEFTATAESHVITIENLRGTGDHTLLMDDFRIEESTGQWSFEPWTGDEDSGIDPAYLYTHAQSFGSNPSVMVNGVWFVGREANVPGRFTLSGLGSNFGNREPNLVEGDGASLAKDFRFGGQPGITLDNLKPETDYVFTVYGIGFDDPEGNTPYRPATFASSAADQRLSVDLNHYGFGAGLRVVHRFRTDESGTPVVISFPPLGSGSFHTSGFSNREAEPSEYETRWSSHEWSDDASSGIEGIYHYTHAYNFASAAGTNIQGVSFTGVPGANPSASNFTTANLGSVYNNDDNVLSGGSEALANDFLYNGFPAILNLSGLEPGKGYLFTLYHVGWEDMPRYGVFVGGVGEDRTVLDQNQFWNNFGTRMEYRYVAPADGTLRITASALDGERSLHIYGFSNREIEPLAGVAPEITLQPTGGPAAVGSDWEFRVGVTGSPELSYVWKRGDDVIPGADGPVLSLFGLTPEDSGDYMVTISNGIGSEAVSEVASLTVLERLPGLFGTGMGADGEPLGGGEIDPNFILTANPDLPGESAAIVQSGIPGAWINSASARWIGPRENTVASAGTEADDGAGAGNYVYQTLIDLTSFDPSTVTIRGRWATDNAGMDILLNGESTGLSYPGDTTYAQFQNFVINQENAPGLTAGVNTLEFVVRNDAVGFTGLLLEDLEVLGFIPAETPPHIIRQPQDVEGPHNGLATLAVVASGSAPMTYRWFHHDEELFGQEEAVLQVPIFDLSAAGEYRVEVRNPWGDVPSETVQLTIPNAAPVPGEDEFDAIRDTPLVIEVFDLLLNDTDPDGDPLEVTGTSTSSVQGGTVEFGDFSVTYTPPAGFTGLDSFTYTVSDGPWGGSATGTVLVTVTAPTIVDPDPERLGPLVIVLGSEGVGGSFVGVEGESYRFRRSTDLANWTTLDTRVAPEGGMLEFADEDPPAGQAFYRIESP